MPARRIPWRAFVVALRRSWTAMRLFCLKITREHGIVHHVSCYYSVIVEGVKGHCIL